MKLGDDIFKVDPAPVDLEEKLKHERTLIYDVSFTVTFMSYTYYVYVYLKVCTCGYEKTQTEFSFSNKLRASIVMLQI